MKTNIKCVFFLLISAIMLTGCTIGLNKETSNNSTNDNESYSKTEEGNTDSPELEDAINIPTEIQVDYSDCFGGINGGAVFYNSAAATFNIYNQQIADLRSSPCSTFKIISALIGLDKEIINSEESVMGYNGTKYEMEQWNSDVNLRDAFKYSCIWYFKKILNQVEPTYVQETLNDLNYGNCDISIWDGREGKGIDPDLNGFWLESSLKISPKEQTKVLSKIFEGKTNFQENHIKILKNIMVVSDNPSRTINVYGKTGSGMNADNQFVDAWFVGMVESQKDIYYFAVRLDDPDNKEVSAAKAKEIALKIIDTYYSEPIK